MLYVVEELNGCTSKQEDMIVDKYPLKMKVMMNFIVVRVIKIIIYFFAHIVSISIKCMLLNKLYISFF